MDFQRAAELRLSIKNNPHDTKLLKEAADYFLSSAFPEEAIKYLLEYNKIIDNDAEIIKLIGIIKGQFGEYSSSKEFLEKSVSLKGNDPLAHYNLALTYLNLKEYNKAIEHFKLTVELNPSDFTAWNDLGVILFGLGKNNEAENCFYRAIDINPDFKESYYNLTYLVDNLKSPSEALKAFRGFLLNENDPDIRNALEKLESAERMRDIDKFKGLKIQIIAFSDIEKDEKRRLRWGDYWFKKEFGDAFKKYGCEIVEEKPDLLLHLFGIPFDNLPKAENKAIWIHSHPDLVSPELLQNYDKIFCLSKLFISKIKRLGFDAELLIGATAKRPLKEASKKYDIVFVGNTKGKIGRKIINDLGGEFKGLKVWGEGWEHILPKENLGGLYYENEKLPELYASAKISLNDHHEDMRREGFINPRIFDVLASGGFVISDKLAGIEDIFGKTVPTYTHPQQLRNTIKRFLEDDEERERLANKGREIALKYSFDRMASQVLQSIFTKDNDKSSLTVHPKEQNSPPEGKRQITVHNREVAPKSKIVIGLDIDELSDFEVIPVINAFNLLSEYNQNMELVINGKPNFDLSSITPNGGNVFLNKDEKKYDIFIDAKLKFSRANGFPENSPITLTPNIKEKIKRNNSGMVLKMETKLDVNYGRLWNFNDLVFKLSFAVENFDNLTQNGVMINE